MSNVTLTYSPEGGSKQAWVFDLSNPPWDITYATETATGWPWGEFAEKLGKGSVIALRALVWTLRKRNEPRLPIESVQVTYAEVDVDIQDDAPEVPEDPKEN